MRGKISLWRIGKQSLTRPWRSLWITCHFISLTIEDGTAFGDRYAAGKLRGLPDDDRAADMYALTQDVCGEAGFAGYEVSNHARSGDESIHNQIYWRYGDYAGIGPGAHGRLTLGGQRLQPRRLAHRWAGWDRFARTEMATLQRVPLRSEEQFAEFLLMGMRLNEGVDLTPLPRCCISHFI